MSSAVYRFENAKTGRAGCQNSACKKEGVKIEKGELRMGTLVTIKEHTSWQWKHWGCVTPRQIANIVDQLGGLDSIDVNDEKDMEALDGWEELDPESKDKIRQSLTDGHVSDEDWKGEPELNRPGMKGINKRTPKKKATEDDETGEADGDATPSKAKAKKPRGKKAKVEEDDDVSPPPKKKAASRKRKADTEEPDEEPEPEKKPARKSRAKSSKAVKAEDDEDDAPPPKLKRERKTKKVKTEESATEEDAPMPEPKSKKTTKSKKPKAEVEEDVPMTTTSPPPANTEAKKLSKKAPAAKSKKSKAAKDGESDVADAIPQDEEPQKTAPAATTKKGRGKKQKAEPEPEPELEAESEAAPADEADTKEDRGENVDAAKGKKKSAKGRAKK